MNRTLTLHLLRHGQATHNIVEWPEKPSSEFINEHLDPPLTDVGVNQAKFATYPDTLKRDPNTVFWVSPLRRAIETAIHAIPQENKKFEVFECVRERGGEKSCDLRRSKSEIIEWVQKQNLLSTWIFDGVKDELDPLNPPTQRESISEMTPRILQTVELMNGLLNEGVENLVIVSHSGFLSILMAFLDVCSAESRWLKNAEWRSLEISFPLANDIVAYKACAGRWESARRSVVVRPKHEILKNAAKTVAFPSMQCLTGICVLTSDMLSSITFSLEVAQRAVVVLPFPLNKSRIDQGENELIQTIVEHWAPVANECPPYIPKSAWKSVQATMTPPFVLNGCKHIYHPPKSSRVVCVQEGVYACAHIVLICKPECNKPSEVPIPDLPIWVTHEYLQAVTMECKLLLEEVKALSVTVLLPHDM